MAVQLARLRSASGAGQTYLGTGDAIHSEASGTLGRYNLYAVQHHMLLHSTPEYRPRIMCIPSEGFPRKDNA